MRYLGIDWGLKKIGLAFSEGQLASPYKVLEIKNLKDGVDKVITLVKKEGVDLVVLGLPEGEMGQVVKKALQLFKKQDIKTEVADETLSTQEAKKKMIELGYKKIARGEDNTISAAIILQRWLDEK